MNPLASLNYQQLVSLAIAAGVKIGGGSWTQALLWGFGSNYVMQMTGFPSCDQLPPGGQDMVQQASGLMQQFMAGQQQTPGQQQTQSPQGGPITDAQYEDYATQDNSAQSNQGYGQGSQVPTPGQ